MSSHDIDAEGNLSSGKMEDTWRCQKKVSPSVNLSSQLPSLQTQSSGDTLQGLTADNASSTSAGSLQTIIRETLAESSQCDSKGTYPDLDDPSTDWNQGKVDGDATTLKSSSTCQGMSISSDDDISTVAKGDVDSMSPPQACAGQLTLLGIPLEIRGLIWDMILDGTRHCLQTCPCLIAAGSHFAMYQSASPRTVESTDSTFLALRSVNRQARGESKFFVGRTNWHRFVQESDIKVCSLRCMLIALQVHTAANIGLPSKIEVFVEHYLIPSAISQMYVSATSDVLLAADDIEQIAYAFSQSTSLPGYQEWVNRLCRDRIAETNSDPICVDCSAIEGPVPKYFAADFIYGCVPRAMLLMPARTVCHCLVNLTYECTGPINVVYSCRMHVLMEVSGYATARGRVREYQ